MSVFRSAACAAAMLLAGCASLSREHGYADASALIEARAGAAPDALRWATPDPVTIPPAPLSAEDAIAIAFVHNPRIREQYARLGLARGELEQARRIANPSFGLTRLRPDGGGPAHITRSLSIGFAELLLLPARKRFATGELERVQHEVAAELLGLSVEVEIAWLDAVGARQVADMRALVATAAATSAELAERYVAAGNINRLQLEQERAAATEARIEAVRALAASLRARSELAGLAGLPAEATWTTQAQLPAPPGTRYDAAALTRIALGQRLDLVAARQAVTLREDALGVKRRWRWLGSVDVGYERERDGDGVAQGPTLTLELPLFDQGQASTMIAQAELVQARARLDSLALGVANDARLAVQRLNVAREIAAHYREALLPARESVVARTQEQVNFMLVGVFELIRARQQQYDAYQAYLEAVRDYWSARAELRRVVGGTLPDDGADAAATIGVETIAPPAAEESSPSHPAADPHSDHRRSAHDDATAPSAGDQPVPGDDR